MKRGAAALCIGGGEATQSPSKWLDVEHWVSLNFGLPPSLGAKLALPQRPLSAKTRHVPSSLGLSARSATNTLRILSVIRRDHLGLKAVQPFCNIFA
jgi:hypothetical protein